MKSAIIMIVTCVIVWEAAPVHAEPGAEPHGVPVIKQNMVKPGKDIVTNRLENLTKRLGLSPEQQAEIKVILQEDVAKLKEIRDNTDLTSNEKKSKLQELRAGTYNKIRSHLNVEQQKIHDAALEKIVESRKIRDGKRSTIMIPPT